MRTFAPKKEGTALATAINDFQENAKYDGGSLFVCPREGGPQRGMNETEN